MTILIDAPTAGRIAPRWFWRIVYWTLFGAFLLAAGLNLLHKRAGFLTNHLADVVVPGWLYLNARGLNPDGRGSTLLAATIGRSPELAALALFVASTLTEISQIYWPHGIFSGRFDPYDILSYGVGVATCYAAERWLGRPIARRPPA